jgi:MFS family permease
MVVFGTLLTTINKPMFAASGWVYSAFGASACLYWITFGKIFDRVSKGVREAPSKALIGELAAASGDSPAGAFGLRQSMATAGALVGAGAAAAAYQLSGQSYVATFVLVTAAFGSGAALMPAAQASADAKAAAAAARAAGAPAAPEEDSFSLLSKAKALLGAFSPAYWQALAVVGALYFARFDASFVTLRARAVMGTAQLPLLTSVIMVTQAALAAPMGLRAKRSVAARNQTVFFGIGVLVAANFVLATVPSFAGMVAGCALIGVHMAMTHGVTIGMLSSYIPSGSVKGLGKVAGTAWSFTDAALGLVLAYSNSLAGSLADRTAAAGLGGVGCFYGGAAACGVSMAALAAFVAFGSLGREDLVGAPKAKAA